MERPFRHVLLQSISGLPALLCRHNGPSCQEFRSNHLVDFSFTSLHRPLPLPITGTSLAFHIVYVCVWLCVCMCVCVHVCLRMSLCMHILDVCVSVYVCVCMCAWVCLCVCIYCRCVCVYVCMCASLLMCVYVCVCACMYSGHAPETHIAIQSIHPDPTLLARPFLSSNTSVSLSKLWYHQPLRLGLARLIASAFRIARLN